MMISDPFMVTEVNGKVNIGNVVRLAGEIGFSQAAPLAMDSLIVRDEVREMCAADRCKSYGKSWSCPPAAGLLSEAGRRMAKYSGGVIVQTTGETGGDFDMQGIREISARHKKNFDTLVRQVRMMHPECMPMGAGTCTRCHKCTYPDRPCRYPDRMYPSMEAYGLLVSDVCRRSGLEYNYGDRTMTFTSCILI